MTSFVSEFVFYLLVFFTHLPLFLLYAVWFKNVRMRLRAAKEGQRESMSVTKSISARMRRKRHLLERKNNDDIATANKEVNDKEEGEEIEREEQQQFMYPEKPMLPQVFPSVCLQLVIDGANDANDQVTEAIDSLCFVHWPRDLLEVHVLDLSSVRTMDIGESKFENAAGNARRDGANAGLCARFLT